jgi:hypothetical protein
MIAAEEGQKFSQSSDMSFGLDRIYFPLALDALKVKENTPSGAWLILRFRQIRCLVPSRLLHFIP